MRVRVVLIVLAVLAATMAGCVPAKAGARCRTSEWGDDGTYALRCEKGRWVRKATKAQVAQLLIAIAKSRQTTTTVPTGTAQESTTTVPDVTTTTLPPPIVPTQISANYRTACARLSNGVVKCWGDNTNSQVLGTGSTTSPMPPTAVAGITGAIAVAAGHDSSCAIVAAGQVKCWGSNLIGQLGDNTTTARTAPVIVVDAAGVPIIGVTQLSAAGSSTCALMGASGQVWCWGDGSSGQLGSGGTANIDSATPVQVSPNTPLVHATAITNFNQHGCALLASSEAWCWGLDDSGQIGNNSLIPPTMTVYARFVADDTGASPRSGITSIAAGDNHTCAVSSDQSVRCWGQGSDGALGHGSNLADLAFPNAQSPVLTAASTPLTGAISVTTGGSHSCALLAGGSVTCWGMNSQGQLGNGTIVAGVPDPSYADSTVILPGPTVAIAAGGSFECFLSAAHEVRCVGLNGSGQLGHTTSQRESTPVLVDLSVAT